MRAGSTPSSSMRYRMRSMRQNVLPAPGPARTSVAPGGASMAARWEGEATCGGTAEVSGGRAISETATGPNLVGGMVRDEEFVTAIGYRLSAIGYRLSAIGYPLPATRYPLPATRHPLRRGDGRSVSCVLRPGRRRVPAMTACA